MSKKAESIIQRSETPEALGEANSLIVRASKSTTGVEPATLTRISSALANRTPAVETGPQYWRTVSTVVNLKSEYTGRPALTNNCFYDPRITDLSPHAIDNNGNIVPRVSPEGHQLSIAEFKLANCSLQIDDSDQFWNSPDGKLLKERETANPNLKTRILVLTNVEVHYSGKQILPFTKIECINCSFVMDVPMKPDPAGQSFMKQLLVADLQEPKLTLSIEVAG